LRNADFTIAECGFRIADLKDESELIEVGESKLIEGGERELSEASDERNGVDGRAAAGDRAPLRVLVVAPSLDILGGQAVQAERLLARLRAEPSLAVSFLPINPRLPGVLRRLQSIKYVRTVVTSLLYCSMLLARVRAFDVIHIFSASYFSFVLAPTPALLVARAYGKRIVLNYHSGEALDHLARWRTAVRTLRLADEIAVPSDYLVEVFARFGLRARAIFNLVETERFRFRARRPLRPVFLTNRNFEPHYNVGCVLRAFALIERRVREARLLVAGDGSQRDELKKLARDLGLRNAEFLGRIAPEKMSELYDAADIYLNGSEIDNQPLSLIESFAAGLPVVTTDAGGIPRIVTDEKTGLLVRRSDHEAMAAAALRLLDDDELAARIASAARAECAKYSWGAVRDGWLDLYHGLTGASAARRDEQAISRGVTVSER
jgi:glycosyltransferase involved in cell wall biosynthesis